MNYLSSSHILTSPTSSWWSESISLAREWWLLILLTGPWTLRAGSAQTAAIVVQLDSWYVPWFSYVYVSVLSVYSQRRNWVGILFTLCIRLFFTVIVPIHIPSAMYGSAHHRTGVCVLCSTKHSSVAAEEGRAGGGQFYVPTSIHSVQLSCFHIEHQQTFSGKKICMTWKGLKITDQEGKLYT